MVNSSEIGCSAAVWRVITCGVSTAILVGAVQSSRQIAHVQFPSILFIKTFRRTIYPVKNEHNVS